MHLRFGGVNLKSGGVELKSEGVKLKSKGVKLRFGGVELKSRGYQEELIIEKLYYNRYRWYNSETGCYISQDPIGLAGNNPTLYAFVKNLNTEVDVFGLDEVKLTEGTVYRTGSLTGNNLTPRPKKDTSSGLSASLEVPVDTKYLSIDVSKLEGTGLEAVNDYGKHVSIRPENDTDYTKLTEWAETRGSEKEHEYTKTLKKVAKSCIKRK